MPALVPVDYDPFFDAAQHDPNALVRLGPGGITPALPPHALSGALEAAYGLTGVPDLQAAYAAAARGEAFPALGQGAVGAAALIPALKPLALAPLMAAGIRSARPIANALGHAENALLPAGSEVNRAVNALLPEAGMYHGSPKTDLKVISASPAQEPIRAYHGSPYDFDAFDASKIGTGEGAQAYGHGLYFAEAPGVAQSYKEALSFTVGAHNTFDGERINPTLLKQLQQSETPAVRDFFKENANLALTKGQNLVKRVDQRVQSAQEQLDYATRRAQELREGYASGRIMSSTYTPEHFDSMANNYTSYLEGLKRVREGLEFKPPEKTGKMYEVNLNAHPDTFLHWDKPLSDQPEAVKQAFNQIVPVTDVPIEHSFPDENWARKWLEINQPGLKDYKILPDPQEPDRARVFAKGYLSPKGEHLDDPTGEQAYQLMSALAGKQLFGDKAKFFPDARNPADATEALRAAGINGIKYLDQGSRGSPYSIFANKEGEVSRRMGDYRDIAEAQKELAVLNERNPKLRASLVEHPQSHNFVVFDPKIIEIIKKYGLAPLIAGGAFATGGDANAATHLVPVDHDPFKTEKP